jgi:hypothetical protein
MAWEYMDELDYRYEQAVELLTQIPHGHTLGQCVELCSGNTRFFNYIKDKCTKYKACDTRKPNVIPDGVQFYEMNDSMFSDTIGRCRTLIVFGHGGFEIDKNPLESPSLTQSMHKIINKCSPKFIILECVDKYLPVIKEIHRIHGREYAHKGITNKSENWLHHRHLYVFYRRDKR